MWLGRWTQETARYNRFLFFRDFLSQTNYQYFKGFNQTHIYFFLWQQKEQALNTIKQNGRSDILSNILNKQSQVKQTKLKETNGHLTKVYF